jgi:hypothetical protein
MRMNRREMLVATGTGGVALATVGLEGCSASQWIQTALTDLPTILQILTSILAVAGVNAGPQVAEYGNEAKADLQTAQSVIAAYKAAAAANKPGLLGQIEAALSAAQANLSGILTVFHSTDDTLAKTIAASVGAALTALLAIQSLIPAPPAATARRMTLAKSAQKDGNEVIKEAFNLIVGRNYPSAVIR